MLKDKFKLVFEGSNHGVYIFTLSEADSVALTQDKGANLVLKIRSPS